MGTAGVIFDCDGTLLDSVGAWLATQDELSARAGHDMTDEETDILNALTIPETGEFFHSRFGLGASSEDVVGMIGEIMHDYYLNRAEARAGALDFVRHLHGAGVKCSVASSTPPDLLQVGLGKNGFLPYLDAVVSVDDVGASKREPAVYDRARELMGTPKESTWVFEDSVYAIKTAKRAGYQVVGIHDRDVSGTLEELAVADIVISGFGELDAAQFATMAGK